ncbi:MAG: organomercurial lyase [Halovenus sp.]
MSDDNDADVPESLCDCCGMTDRPTPRTDGSHDAAASGDSWRPEPSVLEAELPEDVQAALGRAVGSEPVETVGAWIATVRRRIGGGPIAVTDLCLAEGETPHWGTMGGERHYFRCFYDAVLLSAIADHPVDVRTVSPAGAVIEAHAVGSDELSVSPPTAVFSFGVARDIERPAGGDVAHEAVYDAVCPYVKAFPDRDAYERWAAEVPAATVAAPLEGATALAAALTAE